MSVNKVAEEEKEDKQSERAQGGPRDNCETVLTSSETGRILDVLSLFMIQLCGFGQSFQG